MIFKTGQKVELRRQSADGDGALRGEYLDSLGVGDPVVADVVRTVSPSGGRVRLPGGKEVEISSDAIARGV